MILHSGKVQALFWLFSFSVMIFIWIIWIVVQTFILSASQMEVPEDRVALIFILYGMLVIFVLAGTVISIFINNKRYTNRFGALFLIIFISFLIGKSIFG